LPKAVFVNFPSQSSGSALLCTCQSTTGERAIIFVARGSFDSKSAAGPPKLEPIRIIWDD